MSEAETGARHPTGVDEAGKERNIRRLRRIEGQIRGLQKMVEEDRYCTDIMTQIASVHEALRGVSRELMRNHLRHCTADAVRSGEARAEEIYEELLDLIYSRTR
jgi:DNA-binding FrmR family transcriptional regulator